MACGTVPWFAAFPGLQWTRGSGRERLCPGPGSSGVLGSRAGCWAGGSSTETRIEKNASKPTTRTRLWLYDIKTKKSIVQDDHCQFCNQDTAGLVAAHARPLLRER